MRIAIAVGQLNRKAGPSVNGIRLARALRERRHDVWVVHRTAPEAVDAGWADEFRDCLLSLPFLHPCDPRYSLAFLRQIRDARPDVVHFNLQTDALILSPVARLLGVRTLYTMRNLLEYNAGWIQSGLKVIGPLSIDRFAAVSGAVADNIVEHRLCRVPPAIIYNGVEDNDRRRLDETRSRIRQELGVRNGDLLVGTCGRLSPDKEQIHLLEALSLLGSRSPHMVIVGDGEMRPQLEHYCREQGLNKVKLVGWQTDVSAFLSAVDVFAFHSMPDSEGLPTVVTEAAMMGLPLLLADIKCLREVYVDGRHALFAKPACASEFADQLLRLLEDSSLRTSIGSAAYEVAHAEFSIDTMADRYLALYEETVA